MEGSLLEKIMAKLLVKKPSAALAQIKEQISSSMAGVTLRKKTASRATSAEDLKRSARLCERAFAEPF